MACRVEPALVSQADGVHDKRDAIPAADRMPHPGRVEILRMASPVHPDLAHRVARLEKHQHAILALQNFEWPYVVHQPGNSERGATGQIWIHIVVIGAAE